MAENKQNLELDPITFSTDEPTPEFVLGPQVDLQTEESGTGSPLEAQGETEFSYSLSNAPFASISKEELDSIALLFKDKKINFVPEFARQISGELAVENPDFSYENLSSGTGPFFDLNKSEAIRNASPELRALSDRDIIEQFTVDPEGRPLTKATYAEGFFRDIIPQGGGFAGAVTGAKVGAKVPGPPQVKLMSSLVSGVLGGLGLYEAGNLATDALMGKERPLLPGEKIEYEKGRTTAGVVPWLLLPWTLSKEVSLGTAAYLKNLAEGSKTPGGVKLAQKAENFLQKIGQEGRAKPIRTTTIEGVIGAGQVVGAGFAEKNFEDSGIARILSETGGGIGASVIANPALNIFKYGGELYKVVKGLSDDISKRGFKSVVGNPLKLKRQNLAVNKIINILEKEALDVVELPEKFTEKALNSLPSSQRIIREQERDEYLKKAQQEYVNLIIDNLASDDLAKDLIDDAGNPINLTAGQRGGSASLLAIEKSLDNLGQGLGSERRVASTKAIAALRNTILTLAQTDDKNATKLAADIAEKVFSSSMQNQLEIATRRIIDSAEKVYGKNPESNLIISERLFDVINLELGLARRQEKLLWNAVPEINITSFLDPDGNTIDVPEFIRAFDNIGTTPEYVEELIKGIPGFAKFVARKKKELGIDVTDVVEDQLSLFDDVAEEAVEEAGVTTKELSEMRSLMLDYARNLTDQPNKARIAYDMADALLSDLNNAPDVDADWRIAYDMARSYSRALNDTYTRAFGGEVLAKKRSGAEKTAPELLAKRLLQGGNDPTYLRIEQINDIGRFAEEYGLEGAEETVGTLAGLTETILRNARKASFDPETGAINPKTLKKWLNDNADLMNQFPALKRDLEKAETANVLLDQTKKVHKERIAKIKSQISFMDLLSNEIDSPTLVVSKALTSKKPLTGLNELARIVDNPALPENVREQAKNGLKASVLDYAFTRAGGSHSGNLRPSVIYDSFFRPIKNSINQISLAEWLRSKKLITEGEVENLRSMLGDMVKYEVSETIGDAENIVEGAGPMLDLYLSITGSALGTRLQRLMGGEGPGSLIAAGRGAQAMRQAFINVPQGLQIDVMTELMSNPRLLAEFMRKPKSARESLRIRERLSQTLFNLGLSPAKTLPAPVFRETMEDDVERLYLPGEEPKRDIPGIDSPLVQRERSPVVQTVSARSPVAPTDGAGTPEPRPFIVAQMPTAQQPSAPQARPSGSSGVASSSSALRARYKNDYPNDIVSSLIPEAQGQGIESLLS
jgi:hypothetical protein